MKTPLSSRVKRFIGVTLCSLLVIVGLGVLSSVFEFTGVGVISFVLFMIAMWPTFLCSHFLPEDSSYFVAGLLFAASVLFWPVLVDLCFVLKRK
jgi:hypothetical protein